MVDASEKKVFEAGSRVDCNKCYHISITEEQQQRLGNKYLHWCHCYNKRLLHRASQRIHDEIIYPCADCSNDNFKHYTGGDSNNPN